MRICASALSLALVIAFADLARAQDTSYTVITNDGSTYEGQLVENVVGNHVTIKLISGEIRTFQASDVRQQGPASSTPPSTPTPNIVVPITQTIEQLRAGLEGPVTYAGPDAVQIHITKANAGEGRLFMESQSGWAPVCTMPCTTAVDPKIDYKLYNSDPFRFPRGAPLDLIVESGGHRTFAAVGGTMIAVASAGAVLGTLVAASVFSSNPTPQTPAEQTAHQQSQSNDITAGVTIIGVSVALLTVGIIFCALHPSPTLRTSTGQQLVKIATKGITF